MKLALILASVVAMFAAECIQVPADKIAARDLAEAVPGFGSLDPETIIGFAPLPGVERILSSRELRLFAERHGLEPQAMPGVCVKRAVQVINRSELSAALASALGLPDAHLEILDYSKQAAPPGKLDFPVAGLNKPPADSPETAVIWRGRLIYDGARSLPVWAKVKITVSGSAAFAAEQIPAGTTIRAEQVKIARMEQFPFSGPGLDSVSQVAGRSARRTIPAGQMITSESLTQPRDVLPGDTVRVHVVDGSATLSLDAVAQSTGSKGDTVMVRNPATGKSFRGVVEDKGKVLVRPSEGVE